MSIDLICMGCGRGREVADELAGTTMKCPVCGAIIRIPGAKKSKSAAREGPSAAEDVLLGPDDPEPQHKVSAPKGSVTRTPRPAPAAARPPREGKNRPAPTPRPKPRPTEDDDGDPFGAGNMYDLADRERPRCPNCRHELDADDSVLCMFCGYHLEKGDKLDTVFEGIERHWDDGPTYRTRLAILLVLEALTLPPLLLGFGLSFTTFGMFLTGTVVWTLALGTFTTIDLERKRSTKRNARIHKTWFVGFVRAAVTTVDLRRYTSLTYHHENGFIGEDHFAGILLFVFLLLLGILPGLIWGYFAFFRSYYSVQLSGDSDVEGLIAYRGMNADQAKEMANTIHDAAGIPYDRGLVWFCAIP